MPVRYLPPAHDLPRLEPLPSNRRQRYPIQTVYDATPLHVVGTTAVSTVFCAAAVTPLTHLHNFTETMFHKMDQGNSVVSGKFEALLRLAVNMKWHQGMLDNIRGNCSLGLALALYHLGVVFSPYDEDVYVFRPVIFSLAISLGFSLVAHPYEAVVQSAVINNTTAFQLLRSIWGRESNKLKVVKQLYQSFRLSLVARILYYTPVLTIFDVAKRLDPNFILWHQSVLWAYTSNIVGLTLYYPVGNMQRMFLEANNAMRSRGPRPVARYVSYFELANELRRTRGITTIWTGFLKTHPFLFAWIGTATLLAQDHLMRYVVASK